MTVAEIKHMVMYQTNNDADDLGDFMPHLLHYINEGYDLLVEAYQCSHLEPAQLLTKDIDTPALPEWMHRALADYATWMVYRNGNPQKQQRGYVFRNAFESVRYSASENRDGARAEHFINIPR